MKILCCYLFIIICLISPIAEEIHIGFMPLISQTKSDDFNKIILQKSWGQRLIEKAIGEKQPTIRISTFLDKNYFAISKIQDIDYWRCTIKEPNKAKTTSVLLARVRIRFLVYDCLKQHPIIRDTVSGYSASSSKHKKSTQWTLLKRAFIKSVRHLGEKIATKLPCKDKISNVGNGQITTQLGKKHGVTANDIFEVLDQNNKVICTFRPYGPQIHFDHSTAVLPQYLQQEKELRQGMTVVLRKKFTKLISEKQQPRSTIKKTLNSLNISIVKTTRLKIEKNDPLSGFMVNPNKYLNASLRKNVVYQSEKFYINFSWSRQAPANWYVYIIHIGMSGKIIVYLPNNYRTPFFQLTPRKDYTFPKLTPKGIRWLKAKVVPNNLTEGVDRFIVLATKNKILLLEDELVRTKKLRKLLVELTLQDLQKILQQLKNKKWCGRVLDMKIINEQ